MKEIGTTVYKNEETYCKPANHRAQCDVSQTCGMRSQMVPCPNFIPCHVPHLLKLMWRGGWLTFTSMHRQHQRGILNALPGTPMTQFITGRRYMAWGADDLRSPTPLFTVTKTVPGLVRQAWLATHMLSNCNLKGDRLNGVKVLDKSR